MEAVDKESGFPIRTSHKQAKLGSLHVKDPFSDKTFVIWHNTPYEIFKRLHERTGHPWSGASRNKRAFQSMFWGIDRMPEKWWLYGVRPWFEWEAPLSPEEKEKLGREERYDYDNDPEYANAKHYDFSDIASPSGPLGGKRPGGPIIDPWDR